MIRSVDMKQPKGHRLTIIQIDGRELVSLSQAAILLGCSRQAVHYAVHRNKKHRIPAQHIPGLKNDLLLVEDVLAYSRCKSGQPETG